MDPRLISYTNAAGNEIRIFGDAALQRQIDRAIAAKNPDKNMVAVAHVDNEGGTAKASVSIFVKIDDDWSLAAACYKESSKPLSYGAEVVWTPF
jgi:hypothetical protein